MSERDKVQDARRGKYETYPRDRRVFEHRATQQSQTVNQPVERFNVHAAFLRLGGQIQISQVHFLLTKSLILRY